MTKDEALDLALEALEKLTDTEQTYEALDLGDKAITAIKQARALDKKADNAMIYKTFEQWMNGDFLEVGEPRKKAYSKDELLLVEMGWNYGYDAGRAVEQALDKKADNARELGLDYEPAKKQRWAVFCRVCKKEWSVSYQHPGKSICADCDDAPLAQLADHSEQDLEMVKAQTAPVQEPVAWVLTEELTKRETTTRAHLWFSNPKNCMWTPVYTTPPAAQPAPVQSAERGEPVATKLETQQFNCFHVSAEDFQRLKALPVGAKLYTTPPAAPVQEPLFWYKPYPNGMYNGPVHNAQIGDVLRGSEEWRPLYTTPPAAQQQWVWLSKEDEQEIKDNCTTVACVLKAVKAKLKEKNT